MIARPGWWTLPTILAALAAGCADSAERAAAPKPAAPSITVEGTLKEGYSGTPITTGEAVLYYLDGGSKSRVAFKTVPNADGRFRMEGVTRISQAYSMRPGWKPPETPEENLMGAKAAPMDYRNTYSLTAPYTADEAKNIDLGTVRVWLAGKAEELFLPACAKKRQKIDALPGDDGFVVFVRYDDAFKVADYWHDDISKVWPKGWKGVICISESTRKVGEYPFEVDFQKVEAHDTQWDVRIVRLPEGKVLSETLYAGAPMMIKESEAIRVKGRPVMAKGDALPRLTDWLKTQK